MIPEGWKESVISELAEVDPETLPSTTNDSEVIDYISLEDVSRGRLLATTRLMFSEAPSRARRVIRRNDVLFGTVRPNLQSHLYYEGDLKRPVASTGFAVVRAGRENDSRFIFFSLMSDQIQAQVDRIIAGSNYPAVSSRDVRTLSIMVPPPSEQRAIAEALSDADALVESLDALIAKKRDMKQAAMQQLLTGRTRLPGFTEEWEILTVGSFARLLKGRGLSRGEISEGGSRQCLLYGELFTKYNQVARAVEGRTDSLDGEPSVWGDVLMPGSTTTTGEDLATATALLVDEVRLGGDVNIIRPNLHRVDSRWLAYVLTHSHRQDIAVRAQGVTIHHLYGRDIASIAIQVPGLEEQSKIAEVLSDMDAEIDALVAKREKAELVKQGMMQELLTGRVRLV